MLQEAIEDFSKALSIDDTNAASYNSRALAYDRLGDYDLALRDFNLAIQLEQENSIFYHNRGFTHRNRYEVLFLPEYTRFTVNVLPNEFFSVFVFVFFFPL